MVRKQVLRAREHSRESLLENILIDILLTPDKEHKKVFQDVHVAGFRNGKNLKGHLVRAKLPNVEITGRSESYGKGNCQVCDFICDTDTFTTKTCGETFKIKSALLNCNSQRVTYLLKCKIFGEVPYVGKVKTKFGQDLVNIKVHTCHIE